MTTNQQQSIIIVAGGKGLRAGGDFPKQFQVLGIEPMLMHTIQAFYDYNPQIDMVLVLPDGFETYWRGLCEAHRFYKPYKIVAGGETRFHSVKNGLAEIADTQIVGVHDAARPFVTSSLIGRCFDAALAQQCGIIPVIDEVNSMRILTEDGSRIIDRQLLKIVQTPQVFPASALKKAYEVDFDPTFTDDASVFEQSGGNIQFVQGDEINIKITTAFDFFIGEQYLRKLHTKR